MRGRKVTLGIVLFSFILSGCLSSEKNIKGAKIEYIEHDFGWQYDSAEEMEVYVRNIAEHPIYNVQIKCIGYYVNNTDWTQYIEEKGEGINETYKFTSIYPNIQGSFNLIIKFYKSGYHTVIPEEVRYVLKDASIKAEFEISWEYDRKTYYRTQTFEYEFGDGW